MQYFNRNVCLCITDQSEERPAGQCPCPRPWRKCATGRRRTNAESRNAKFGTAELYDDFFGYCEETIAHLLQGRKAANPIRNRGGRPRPSGPFLHLLVLAMKVGKKFIPIFFDGQPTSRIVFAGSSCLKFPIPIKMWCERLNEASLRPSLLIPCDSYQE